jgi:unsaturated chondroitin disaccharide hydrolase
MTDTCDSKQARLTVSQVQALLRGWLRQVACIVELLGNDFPDYYDPQVRAWARNGGWTEGFWTGILWWLYAWSRDERYLAWARHYTRLLAAQKAEFSDHDLGFLFYHSCVLESLLTGDDEMVPAALAAARRLAARFNPAGRFIRAHGALDDPERAGYAIVDTAMNLRLLFWAYEVTGEALFYDIGWQAALTITREFVREDGSTYQVVWFDPQTGAVKEKGTLQGYNATSCWSRGQAWGIYGLTQVYKFTGDPYFKEHVAAMARYFLAHLPPDGVVPYDFADPRGHQAPKDTSAQAIAGAGLLALAALATGQERRAWQAAGERLLAALCHDYAVTLEESEQQPRGLLRGGCYFLAQGRGVNCDLMFGDYYLVEGLMRFLSMAAWT